MSTFQYPFYGRVDTQQLAQELAPFNPTAGTLDDDTLTITFSAEPTAEQHLQIKAIIAAHVPVEFAQLDQLVEKARQVWRGEATFTQAQAQKILAGLVLVVARYLR